MVKTPWHARWRLYFATEWHSKCHGNRLSRTFIHGDEKKFCLWDSDSAYGWVVKLDEHGNICNDDDGSGEWPECNVAHALTDEQYAAWLSELKEKGENLQGSHARSGS